MDCIEFHKVRELYEGRYIYTVDIHVNGRKLVDVVKDIELPQAMDEQKGGERIAGAYGGIWAGEGVDLVKHFLGKGSMVYEDEGKTWTPLFVCSDCREEGCWSLHAEIVANEECVLWRRFRHNHRPNWTYTGLGPYEYERKSYEEALLLLGI